MPKIGIKTRIFYGISSTDWLERKRTSLMYIIIFNFYFQISINRDKNLICCNKR